MLAGVSASLFNRACFNYPTLGKRYKLATYEAFLNATDSFPDTPDQTLTTRKSRYRQRNFRFEQIAIGAKPSAREVKARALYYLSQPHDVRRQTIGQAGLRTVEDLEGTLEVREGAYDPRETLLALLSL